MARLGLSISSGTYVTSRPSPATPRSWPWGPTSTAASTARAPPSTAPHSSPAWPRPSAAISARTMSMASWAATGSASYPPPCLISRPGGNSMTNTLFAGCQPEIACNPVGTIVAVGAGARTAAGRGARRVELAGRVLPGLGDAHLHLEWLTLGRRRVDLTGITTRAAALKRTRRFAAAQEKDAWISGAGWSNDLWTDDPSFPNRHELDEVTGGRPAVLVRKGGHSAWLNSLALRAAGFSRDPHGAA